MTEMVPVAGVRGLVLDAAVRPPAPLGSRVATGLLSPELFLSCSVSTSLPSLAHPPSTPNRTWSYLPKLARHLCPGPLLSHASTKS